jgi:integrase
MKNPVSGLYFSVKPGRLRYLERQEAVLLLELVKKAHCHYLSDFIELAFNTGARKNELLLLKFVSVDSQRRILTIEGYTTKTGKRRYLPINRNAYDAFLRLLAYRGKYCPVSPWVFSKRSGGRMKYLEKTFHNTVKRAGLQDFHIHDLRHIFASWLVSEGVDLIKVRDLLGHSSIRMTERYAHLALNRLHEVVGMLDGLYERNDLDFG